MFGINDSNKNNAQGTPPDANIGTAVATPLSVGSGSVSSSSQPVVTPPSSQDPSPLSPVSSAPTETSSSTSGSLKDVNLEKAYMANDPSATPGTDSSDTNKSDSMPTAAPSAASLVDSDHEEQLIKLKQQALQNLAPLVDHLEQTPEEKFKTTMMLIQASDNAELVKEAYEAANQITDEKARAQALLDVVNEINYFTQHQQGDTDSN